MLLRELLPNRVMKPLLLLPLLLPLRPHLEANQSLVEKLPLVLMSLLALDLMVKVRQRQSLKSQQLQRQLEVNLPQLVERLSLK